MLGVVARVEEDSNPLLAPRGGEYGGGENYTGVNEGGSIR